MRTTRNRYKQEIQARTRRLNTDTSNNRRSTEAVTTCSDNKTSGGDDAQVEEPVENVDERRRENVVKEDDDVRGKPGDDGDDEDSSSDDDDDSSDDDSSGVASPRHDVKSSPLFSGTTNSTMTSSRTGAVKSPFATTPRITGNEMSSDASSASDSSGQSDSDDSFDDVSPRSRLPRTDASGGAGASGAISVQVGRNEGRAAASVLNSPSDIVRDVALLSTNSVKSNDSSSSSCSSVAKTSPVEPLVDACAQNSHIPSSPPASTSPAPPSLSPAPRSLSPAPASNVSERKEVIPSPTKSSASPINSNDLSSLLSSEYQELRRKPETPAYAPVETVATSQQQRLYDRSMSEAATITHGASDGGRTRHASATQFSPNPPQNMQSSCAVQQLQPSYKTSSSESEPHMGSTRHHTAAPQKQDATLYERRASAGFSHHRNSVEAHRQQSAGGGSYSNCAQQLTSQQQQLGGFMHSQPPPPQPQQQQLTSQNQHFSMSLPSPHNQQQQQATNFNMPNPSPSNYNNSMPQPSPGAASYALPQSSPSNSQVPYNITNPSPGGGAPASNQGMPTPSPTNSNHSFNMTAPSPGGGNPNVAAGNYGYASGQSGGYMHEGSHLQMLKGTGSKASASSVGGASKRQRNPDPAGASGYSQRGPHSLAHLQRLANGPEYSLPPVDLSSSLGHPPPLVHSPSALMNLPTVTPPPLPGLHNPSRARDTAHVQPPEVTSHQQRLAHSQYGSSASGSAHSSKHHRQRSSSTAQAQSQQQHGHLQKPPAPNVTVSAGMSLHHHPASFQNPAASQLLRNSMLYYPSLSQQNPLQYGSYAPFMNQLPHVGMPPQMLPGAHHHQMQQGGSGNPTPSMYSPYYPPFGQAFNMNSSSRR